MEETKEQQSLHRFLQAAIYLTVLVDILLFIVEPQIQSSSRLYQAFHLLLERLSKTIIYQAPLNGKLFTFFLICLVAAGTLSRKKRNLNPQKEILLPLFSGFFLLALSIWCYGKSSTPMRGGLSGYQLTYIFGSLSGTILLHISMDNVSKIISSSLGKDKWNVEGESFMQPLTPCKSPYSVSIPMLFYFRKKVHKGWVRLENIFRGTLVIGTPGSGKSFGVIMPVIRQLIARQFAVCLYDFKFPDLGKVAYYHYLLAKQQGKCADFSFHVINLTEVERSRRINVLKREYVLTLADASETAEGLVEALKKGDKSGGSDQFFTQSAVNFLAACIYFFVQHDEGRYGTFAHVLAFLNRSYEEIFRTLFNNKELTSLLSPFMTAYQNKAFDQLEGQVGTLKVFISRLATKETFWVFSADDFNLKISDPLNPAILVLANDPNTQNINSACYSVILNRLTRLINSKGNLPSSIIVDEVPTLFIHRIENLIATARSNKVAVVLGLQELTQFRQQYGKDTASTITSVIGNVLSGSVRDKGTLDWLERLFGKVKQEAESLSIDRAKTSVSLSEKLEPLIPAGKIASLKAGEMVGLLSGDAVEEYTGKFETSAVNCRINLDLEAIKQEEAGYKDLPVYYDFGGRKETILRNNFFRIDQEVRDLVNNFRSLAPASGAVSNGGGVPKAQLRHPSTDTHPN